MAGGGQATEGSFSFFAAWLLLHEKADDWLKDALRRAKETPTEARKDYQSFLLGVESQKEHLKGIFSEALVHELRHVGFVHRDDAAGGADEIGELRERIAALEDQLSRIKEKI